MAKRKIHYHIQASSLNEAARLFSPKHHVITEDEFLRLYTRLELSPCAVFVIENPDADDDGEKMLADELAIHLNDIRSFSG